MTPEVDVQNIESTRHDPLLRLDQFIHRQDEMIRLLKVQIQLAKLLAFGLGVLVFLLTALVIYGIWK